MFKALKSIFLKKEVKQSYPYLQSQLCFLNAAQFSPLRYDIFSYEGYMSNPIVYRCINIIATAVAGIPWKLYRKLGDDKDVEIESSPILDLLYKPNPRVGQSDFFTDLISYLQISGNTYVKGVGPINGPPRELYTLRPDFFNIIDSCTGCYDEDTRVYQYTCSGVTESIPAKSIWHGKLWNPLCEIYGLSPLQAAWRSIIQLNEAMNWNISLLQNSASPSGVLTAEGNLTDEQVMRLKEQLATKYQSMRNAGRAMVLDGGLKWDQMSMSPRDMEFDIGQKMATKNICVALGVDPVLLGDSDNRTYATYRDAEKSFYISTVLPNLDRIRDDFLNSWLLSKFPGTENMYFDYDRDAIEVLSEDRTVLWDRAISGVKEGLITVNEARNSIGYSELVTSSAPSPERDSSDEDNEDTVNAKKKSIRWN